MSIDMETRDQGLVMSLICKFLFVRGKPERWRHKYINKALLPNIDIEHKQVSVDTPVDIIRVWRMAANSYTLDVSFIGKNFEHYIDSIDMNVCCRTFSWIHRNATVIMYTPLKALGFPISFVQILHRIKQPWLMSPYKHGLFFVLNDGFCFQGLPRPPLHHYPTDAQTLHRSRLRTTASLLSIFCLLPASGAQWSTEQLQGSLWGDWKQTFLLYVVFSLLFVMCHCDWKASVKKVLIWLCYHLIAIVSCFLL